MPIRHPLLSVLSVLACLAALPLSVPAAVAHEHHAAAESSTAGNAGAPTARRDARPGVSRKFATDENLRQGMLAIAQLYEKAWSAVESGQMQAADYKTVTENIDRQTADIIKNCKLDARSDKALHEILYDIRKAEELMLRAQPMIARTGVIALGQALRNYARYFDHPGWTGPQPQ